MTPAVAQAVAIMREKYPDDLVDFDERAGIAEYDGGLSRDEAEALALEYVRGEHKRRQALKVRP